MSFTLEEFYRCFESSKALEDLRKLYAEQAERTVADARRKHGLDDKPSAGYAKLYAEALAGARTDIDRGVAFRGARVSTLESTVNLKQNELLALIAQYSRELNMMIEARSTGAGTYRDENGPGLKGLVSSHVERMTQLAAELA